MDNENGNPNGDRNGTHARQANQAPLDTAGVYLVPGYFVKHFKRQMYWLRGLEIGGAAEEVSKLLDIYAQMDRKWISSIVRP
jgi:hypothetical protein